MINLRKETNGFITVSKTREFVESFVTDRHVGTFCLLGYGHVYKLNKTNIFFE